MSSLEETVRSGIRVVGTVAVTLLALSACGAVDDTPTTTARARLVLRVHRARRTPLARR